MPAVIGCATCRQPMTALGTITTGAAGELDARAAEFEALLLERYPGADGSLWQVYECRAPGCGCGCRRYIPA